MKKMKLPVLFVVLPVVLFGYGCQESKVLNMEQVHQLEDSLPKVFPTVQTINTLVEKSSELKIVIGDTRFYTAEPAVKQQKANEAGMMALHVFGQGITKGKLVVTKDVANKLDNPQDGISTDMNIDSLKKIVFPAK